MPKNKVAPAGELLLYTGGQLEEGEGGPQPGGQPVERSKSLRRCSDPGIPFLRTESEELQESIPGFTRAGHEQLEGGDSSDRRPSINGMRLPPLSESKAAAALSAESDIGAEDMNRGVGVPVIDRDMERAIFGADLVNGGGGGCGGAGGGVGVGGGALNQKKKRVKWADGVGLDLEDVLWCDVLYYEMPVVIYDDDDDDDEEFVRVQRSSCGCFG